MKKELIGPFSDFFKILQNLPNLFLKTPGYKDKESPSIGKGFPVVYNRLHELLQF